MGLTENILTQHYQYSYDCLHCKGKGFIRGTMLTNCPECSGQGIVPTIRGSLHAVCCPRCYGARKIEQVGIMLCPSCAVMKNTPENYRMRALAWLRERRNEKAITLCGNCPRLVVWKVLSDIWCSKYEEHLETNAIWWATLAAFLQGAIADRQRIEALANAAITVYKTNMLGSPKIWYIKEKDEYQWEVGALGDIYRGATLFDALDALVNSMSVTGSNIND